jgi:hypothetical protein
MVTFRDFQFIQNHMARRIAAMNKPAYAAALIGIVLCAVLLTMAVVINLSRIARGFGSERISPIRYRSISC